METLDVESEIQQSAPNRRRFSEYAPLLLSYRLNQLWPPLVCVVCVNGIQVAHDGKVITIDGQGKILLSGSIHYPHSTSQMWPDLIKKAKEGGLDAIETYVFWNVHEPQRSQYDFNDNLDLLRFIKTIHQERLYSVVRIGPYVCAEWNYEGFPVWLHNMPRIELQTANNVYMNEMQNFTTLIVDMLKKEKLLRTYCFSPGINV